MATLSGNSSEEMKKRKRKQSNRESARRSRMRKQKHLDDLTAQIALLKRDNSRIVATLQETTRQLLGVEADNSILRAQMNELTNRLDSLNGILSYMNNNSAADINMGIRGREESEVVVDGENNELLMMMGSHWSNFGYVSQQPIMASADYHVFGY